VATDRVEAAVIVGPRVGSETLQKLETSLGPVNHAHRDGMVQSDDRVVVQAEQDAVEGSDLRPVSRLHSALRGVLQHEDAEIGQEAPPPEPLTNVPSDEALLRPDVIEVGSHGAETVRLGLCDWAGLELAGAGAEAALRAWLAALVTRNGPYGADLDVVNGLVDVLFPGVSLPSVTVVADCGEALCRLESRVVGRTRYFEEADVPDAIALRKADPALPTPLALAVVDGVPEELAGRWRGTMRAAGRLGLAAVTLGAKENPHFFMMRG
jgi:hypothetical protein